jgi:hypothetical protein
MTASHKESHVDDISDAAKWKAVIYIMCETGGYIMTVMELTVLNSGQ